MRCHLPCHGRRGRCSKPQLSLPHENNTPSPPATRRNRAAPCVPAPLSLRAVPHGRLQSQGIDPAPPCVLALARAFTPTIQERAPPADFPSEEQRTLFGHFTEESDEGQLARVLPAGSDRTAPGDGRAGRADGRACRLGTGSAEPCRWAHEPLADPELSHEHTPTQSFRGLRHTRRTCEPDHSPITAGHPTGSPPSPAQTRRPAPHRSPVVPPRSPVAGHPSPVAS